MNTDFLKKSKKWVWKRLFKLMNNAVFGKNMDNVRKHRNILSQEKEEVPV